MKNVVKFINQQNGMTLIEVLVSLTILCLLSVMFFGLSGNAQVWMSNSGAEVKAAEYAEGIMENIRAQSDKLIGITMSGNPPGIVYRDGDLSHSSFAISDLNLLIDDPEHFSEQVTITPFIIGNDNLYKVVVQVSWTSRGKLQSWSLVSVVAAR